MNKNLLIYIKAFLNTPPLWIENTFDINQFKIPEINWANFTPASIPDNIRLGHQIEHLFFQIVGHSKEFNILIYNEPIRNKQRTLGEIDFIIENTSSKQLVHVELTYKFYIIDTSTEEYKLIGPNRKDAFFTKLEKIKNIQFPLLHSPEAIKVIEEKGINTKNIIHQTCFKAQLFVPYQEEIIISKFNKNCIVGFWIHFNHFSNNDFKSQQYYIPTKKEWMLVPHNNVVWKSYDNLYISLTSAIQEQRSPMIWSKNKENTHTKFFIVWW